jgi:hypothetical protein
VLLVVVDPEAATAVDKLLMMGTKLPTTCWAVFKRQAIKLKDWCIWLVDLFEYMMIHKLTNRKQIQIRPRGSFTNISTYHNEIKALYCSHFSYKSTKRSILIAIHSVHAIPQYHSYNRPMKCTKIMYNNWFHSPTFFGLTAW